MLVSKLLCKRILSFEKSMVKLDRHRKRKDILCLHVSMGPTEMQQNKVAIPLKSFHETSLKPTKIKLYNEICFDLHSVQYFTAI